VFYVHSSLCASGKVTVHTRLYCATSIHTAQKCGYGVLFWCSLSIVDNSASFSRSRAISPCLPFLPKTSTPHRSVYIFAQRGNHISLHIWLQSPNTDLNPIYAMKTYYNLPSNMAPIYDAMRLITFAVCSTPRNGATIFPCGSNQQTIHPDDPITITIRIDLHAMQRCRSILRVAQRALGAASTRARIMSTASRPQGQLEMPGFNVPLNSEPRVRTKAHPIGSIGRIADIKLDRTAPLPE
jgi:hypothetical protein